MPLTLRTTALCAALLMACKPAPLPGEPNNAARLMAMSDEESPTEAGTSTLIAVTVNGRPITLGAIERRLATVAPEMSYWFATEGARTEGVQTLVMAEILAMAAENEGLIGTRIEALNRDLAQAQAWELHTRASFAALADDQELVNRTWEELQHRLQWGEIRRAQFALLPDLQSANDFIQTYNHLRTLGSDRPEEQFRDVVMRRGAVLDPSSNDIVLDWVSAADAQHGANPDLVAALFALQNPGDISPPVATEAGFFVLQFASARSAPEVSAEQASDFLLQYALTRASGEHLHQLIAAARESATVSIDEAVLQQLQRGDDEASSVRRYSLESLTRSPRRLLEPDAVARLQEHITEPPTGLILSATAPQPTPVVPVDTEGSAQADGSAATPSPESTP